MKTKKTLLYPKKKTTISIVALHKNINTSRQKFSINKSTYNELIQPKSTRSSFSIRNSLIAAKPKLSVPLITKPSLNQIKHSILFNGLNKSKNSYEAHSTIHSITGFNSKILKHSMNILKENGHKTNRTITNLPSGKNIRLGKVKIKSTKCSINSQYVKLDEIIGNNVNKVQKKMPKKEVKKLFLSTRVINNNVNSKKVKNANNYSHIDPLPKAVTEGNEVPLISKKRASTKTIKDSIISLNQNTSISQEKIKSDLLKTNQKEYTLDDILDNTFGNDDNNDCDKVGDLYSVVKKIKFELVDPKRINIWSVYNDNYESFCNEFNDKYSSQFTHNKLSDSKITNSSHSTQQNSNKKTPTVKTF